MIRKLIFITALLFIQTLSAKAQPIVSGISTNEINIDTKFNGAKILLFGAKGDAGNIVIAVRGPKKNFLVTKKKKLLGVWYNGRRIEFKDSVSYYSTFSTFEEDDDDDSAKPLLSKLEIGSSNLKFETEEEKSQITEDFSLKLIEKLKKDKLYAPTVDKIDFLDETLFKVILDFPKNISRGIYTVEIYLINEENLISFQSIPIYVNQVGLSAKMSDYAHKQSFLYGVLAVILALTIGWITNFLFARFFGK